MEDKGLKVLKITKRGRQYFMVDFRDRTGDRRRKPFRTKAEAESYAATVRLQLDRNEYVSAKAAPLFSEAAAEWLAEKSDRRPGTVANWEHQIRLHIKPGIGALKTHEITVARLEHFRDELRQKGLSPRSVNAILTTTSAIFSMAERRGYCHRNPVARMERAYLGTGELASGCDTDSRGHFRAVNPQEVLSPAEVKSIIDAPSSARDKAFLVTALMTGARVSELLGLRWSDLDLHAADPDRTETGRGLVHIRRTFSWARVHREDDSGEKGPIAPRTFAPKTRSGSRQIEIPREALLALKEWKLQCPPNESDLVFPGKNGEPMHRSRPLVSILRPALKRCRIQRRITIHGCRHSFASIHILNRTPLTELQTLLGHASPTITLKTYAHWFDGLKTQSVERFAASIFSSGNAEDRLGTKRAPDARSEQVANGAAVA